MAVIIRLIKKSIGSFLSSSRKLYWFYILLNMVPSIFLVFSEPLDIFGKTVLILFPSGLYIFIYSLSKNTGLIQTLLFPLVIIHAFQLVVFYLFGEDVIAADMFLNLVTTNSSEAGELLNSIWPSIIFVCVLYIPAVIIAIRQYKKKIYLDLRFRKNMAMIGCFMILIAYIFSFFSKDENTHTFSFGKNVYPANVFYNLNFAVNKWHRTQIYPVTSEGFTFEAKKDSFSVKREIYVLLIGETGRAENWSLYGYERKTNPLTEQLDGLVFFDDVITQSNTTHKSVSVMLSAASADNYSIIYEQKSIIQAFREAGFATVFLSNQGSDHTFIRYFAEEADYYRDIRRVNGNTNVINNYDEILLPLLKHCIDSIQGNIFAVLHTYGSHFNYKERYPKEFSVFKPDDVTEITRNQKDRLLNAYDNSILYTDNFLYGTAELLKESNTCSAFLYVSDHGEDILDDHRMRFLHASPNPTFYQLRIPMLLWFSPDYASSFPVKAENARKNKTKPVATNAVFHTLLDMASIQTNYLYPDLSLVNRSFAVRKRMYLDDHDEPVFYYNTNLKKEDKEMIEKRKMHH